MDYEILLDRKINNAKNCVLTSRHFHNVEMEKTYIKLLNDLLAEKKKIEQKKIENSSLWNVLDETRPNKKGLLERVIAFFGLGYRE